MNKLVSEWVTTEHAALADLGPRRFHVASYCTQHKTGNAVQQVTEHLGLIRPGFALASCLGTGSIADSLDRELRAILLRDLEVMDPAAVDLELDAPEDAPQIELLRELFEVC